MSCCGPCATELERAEAEQALRVEQGRLNERARIAREMHDVLAHRISLIAMHAGALAYRTDLTAEETHETAELIQATSHEALTDLRQVLGVLRDDETGAGERPQPTFGDLAALVLEAEGAGMRIQYDDRVDGASQMPEQVGRTAYRIVQEGLTNVRKHAPGVTVLVQLSGSPTEGVSIRIRNPARSSAARRRRAPSRCRTRARRARRARQARRRQAHHAARRRIVRAHRVAAVEDVSRAIRVLVVDDDALVQVRAPDDPRRGARHRGGRRGGRRPGGCRRRSPAQPDVVLMDIRMPRMDGLEATEVIGSWPDPPKVIVLTTFDADDYVARALGAGASGFLLKDTAPAEIIEAIRRVADGDPMLSPSVTTRLIEQLTSGQAPDRTRIAKDRLSAADRARAGGGRRGR